MTKIDGREVVDSYDVFTVTGEVAGEPMTMVCPTAGDALEANDALGGKITVATHYATEQRDYVPEMADAE